MSFTSRWSDVYVVAGTRAVSVCGDFLAATTLALVLQQAGHGGLAVSGLLVAASLPLALLAPIAGRVADRADSRTVLVVAGLAQAAVCLVLAYTEHPVAIIGMVALLSCGLAVTQPTTAALIPRMVREEDLAKASGLSQTAGTLGMLIAPALAGVLVGQSGGARLPLLLDAASYLALVVAGLTIRTRRRAINQQKSVDTVAWKVTGDRTLVLMIGTLAAVVAGLSSFNVFDVFFVRDTLGASTTVFGIVAASWTAGMLVGSALFGRTPRRWITVPALLLLITLSCVPIMAAGAVGNALWLIPLWVVGGIGNGGTNVYIMVIVAGRAPAEAHGRAFAAVGAAVQAAGLAGLLVAGPLVESFDPRVLVTASGAVGLATTLACLVLVRREPATAPERQRERVPA
jgi:MFS family permease